MSSETFSIRVSGLCKQYQIYDTPRDRLKQFLLPGLQRALGLRPREYFTPFKAIEGVGFEVGRGETVGIIGRNGSGKSTLLQIICGTLAPTSGGVRSNGRIAALLELGSGFNPEFSGRENVLLNAAILGMDRAQIESRFESIERFAEIGDFIDQPVKTYSSGMVVRLAFATAIHVDPDILVVDEALAVGDVAFQQKCLNHIRKMQADGVSILLVTHSTNALIEYCDRAIYLRKGHLVLDGACREVVKAYADDLVEMEAEMVLDVYSERAADAPIHVPVESAASVDDECRHAVAREVPLQIESVRLVDDAGMVSTAIEFGAKLGVVVRVLANERIQTPCFGIQIASVDGIALWSATTLELGVEMPELEPGVHEFCWDLQVNFAGNRYVIAVGVGVVQNGEYRRTERADYAGHFDVIPLPAAGSGWLAPRPSFQRVCTVGGVGELR